MGMDATLIGIGFFSPQVAHHLCYPADHYDGVPRGAPVITTVVELNASEPSRRLAEILGIDPTDLGGHQITQTKAASIDPSLLGEAFGEGVARDFSALRRNGFRFYFMPNY